MKSLYVVLSIAVLFSPVLAQIPIPSESARRDQPMSNPNETIVLTGKVMVEGGSAPPDPVNVVLRCGMEEKARATSSHKGDFSLMFTSDSTLGERSQGAPSFNDGSGCEIYADSPDYVSESVQLFGEVAGTMNQVGTIMLHPRTAAQGATISATSLAAPDKAKEAFEKGQAQERKGKLKAATDFFRRAIEVYPQYAIAWLELGRAQFRQNDFNSAQQSFFQATTHDSRLVGGYEGLAELALRQGRWKDLANSTAKILEISPDAAANVWFLNSAANFKLGDMKRAETSVVRGIHLDSAHRVPQLEYLYGIILARRSDYGHAIQHLQAYLQLAPNSLDSKDAMGALAQLQKLAASNTQPETVPSGPTASH